MQILPGDSCKNCAMERLAIVKLKEETLKCLFLLVFWRFLFFGYPWHRACNSQGGATRYQVVNSTDGVKRLPG
jgi:hypothetical protein